MCLIYVLHIFKYRENKSVDFLIVLPTVLYTNNHFCITVIIITIIILVVVFITLTVTVVIARVKMHNS